MTGKGILRVLVFLASLCSSLEAGEYRLIDLYRIALERAEKIRIGEEDVYVAARQKDKALSLLLPKLTAVGTYVRNRDAVATDTGSIIQPYDSPGFTVRFDQSMSLSGREITAYNMAKDGISRARSDLDSTRESYMMTVAAVYYDYARAKKIVAIAGTNVERLTRYKNAAATRLKVGEVTKTVLIRAEAELSGARSELIRSTNRIALSKAALARVVGLMEDFDIVEEDMVTLAAASEHDTPVGSICRPLAVECLRERAYGERSEIKALEIQKRIAQDAVRVTKGLYWPTLAVEGAYVRAYQSPETSGIVRDNVYGGLRLSFPFFEGGLRVAEVREAEAKQRQAELSLMDTKKTIGLEVESSFLFYSTQRGVLKSLEDQYRFARENFTAVSRQFDFGLASSLDVLDANTTLVTAERELVDAIYNYQLAVASLKRAVGVLLKDVMGGNEAGGAG
jgi:outer membrane protein